MLSAADKAALTEAIRIANIDCDAERPEKAVELLASAARAYPNQPTIRVHLALALATTRRFEEARLVARAALRLAPRLAEAWCAASIVARRLGQYEEAERSARQAVILSPIAESYLALGDALGDLGKTEDAIWAFRHAETLSAERGRDNIGLAHMLLRRGEWIEGWDRYESRYCEPGWRNFKRPTRVPLNGKRVLVQGWFDSGLGDQIALLRYLPPLADIAASVTLEIAETLVPIAAAAFGDRIEVLSPKATEHRIFDTAFTLQSLPYMLGENARTLPPAPFLRAPQEHAWRDRVASLAQGRRAIALVYAGGNEFRDDHLRSPGLDAVRPLLDLPGHAVFVLQKGPGRRALPAFPHVHDLADEFQSMSATAAIMAACDAVVSSCTSSAHLAGALGLPLYALLPASAYFMWGERPNDCDWYPTARLFRQPRVHDWQTPVSAIAAALRDEQRAAA